MIEIKNISFSYGEKEIFCNYSLDIPDGITVIEGPSGGGKTTFLRLIAGLEKPLCGTITGVPNKIAFMFQEDRLLPWLTAEENVACVMPSKSADTASEFLRETELEEYAKVNVNRLSGGQRRRVALSRALAYGGGLLILDESLKGLDPALTERIVQRIRKRNVSVIVTSHSEFETALWGGRIITVENK